jgi:hypothetical protein
MRHYLFSVTAMALLMIGWCICFAQPATPRDALRQKVLNAASPHAKADAYRTLFQSAQSEIANLTKDKDISIALQASWESNKKLIKRLDRIDPRLDDQYDRTALDKFVRFFKERTKAPVPEWWARDIVEVDVMPGRFHRFSGGPVKQDDLKQPGVRNGGNVMKGGKLGQLDGMVTYSVGNRLFEFGNELTASPVQTAVATLATEEWAAIAPYDPRGGFMFKIGGFKAQGGKAAWTADVWAVGRAELIGQAPHRVDLTTKDNSVFIFGGEPNGMYAESFDMESGESRFRFCTCYWFYPSEKWKQR